MVMVFNGVHRLNQSRTVSTMNGGYIGSPTFSRPVCRPRQTALLPSLDIIIQHVFLSISWSPFFNFLHHYSFKRKSFMPLKVAEIFRLSRLYLFPIVSSFSVTSVFDCFFPHDIQLILLTILVSRASIRLTD